MVLIRPERVRLLDAGSPDAGTDAPNVFRAVVAERTFQGAATVLTLHVAGTPLLALRAWTGGDSPPAESTVTIAIDPADVGLLL